MNATDNTPKSLLEAVVYFSDERRAWKVFVARRWPDGNVKCPRCESDRVHLIETRMVWRCNGCKRQFSVKVGTIFEDSALPLSKWLPAMWLITNAKNGISSCELARALNVQQRTAWFMLHRIRLAMQNADGAKLSGTIEANETYVGGKARNMHKAVRERKVKGTGGIASGKAIVFGMLQRGGTIKAQVIPAANRWVIQSIIRTQVQGTSSVFTDEHMAYRNLRWGYLHQFVDHTQRYVNGVVHTDGPENFWSLLKRSINGTYVSVEPFHLNRYVDEQAFRFNERALSDGQRF